jgi:S23 ribosomal protein.
MDLAVLVYDLTESFPPEEKFGLAFQMRKAAVSAPSNISEGTTGRSSFTIQTFFGDCHRLSKRIKHAVGNSFSSWLFVRKRLFYGTKPN